jgi:hypothetical protein
MFVHWFIFGGVSYCDNSVGVFMFDYETKEKEHHNTRQSELNSGATPPRTNQILVPSKYLSYTYIKFKSTDRIFKGMSNSL